MSVSQVDLSNSSTATSESSEKRKRFDTDEEEERGNPKPYKCRFCLKSFHKSQALGGHMNSHRQEREEEQFNNAKQLVLGKGREGLGAPFGTTLYCADSARPLPNTVNRRMALTSPNPLSESSSMHQPTYNPTPLTWNTSGTASQQVNPVPEMNVNEWLSQIFQSNSISTTSCRNFNFSTKWSTDTFSGSSGNSKKEKGLAVHNEASMTSFVNNAGSSTSMNPAMTSRFNANFQSPIVSESFPAEVEYKVFQDQSVQEPPRYGYASDLQGLFSSGLTDADFDWKKANRAISPYNTFQNCDTGICFLGSEATSSQVARPYQSSMDLINVDIKSSPYDAASGVNTDLYNVPPDTKSEEKEMRSGFHKN